MKYNRLLLVAALVCSHMLMANSDETAENEAALSAAVRGINTFSTALYQTLRGESGNLVMSPFSVEAVVAMLQIGMRGPTADQVSSALHLPTERALVQRGFKTLFNSLQNTENVTLELANKMYIQKGFGIKEDYQRATEEHFLSVSEEADIIADGEEVRKAVNAWASEKTHGKIQDLLAPGALTPDVVLILLNAIYFKGLWKNSFMKEETRDEVFHLTSSSTKEVPMMHITTTFAYTDVYDQNFQMLKLPYQGGKHSMLILLPKEKEGLSQLEANINNIDLIQLSSNMGYREVVVTLPRFKILKSIDLKGPLTKLGMGVLFGGGNFSGVTDENVYVSKALQKAFIEVNEEGTEAAAVTALVIAIESAIIDSPPPVLFNADHPFMYVIMEEETRTILFLGRVVDPALQPPV